MLHSLPSPPPSVLALGLVSVTLCYVAPLPHAVIAEAGAIELGRARCDTRLAHVLHSAGFDVLNPSLALHAMHLQVALLPL